MGTMTCASNEGLTPSLKKEVLYAILVNVGVLRETSLFLMPLAFTNPSVKAYLGL